MKLPIDAYRKDIVESAKNNPVTVVVGETGSGKTNRIGRFLYAAGFRKIAVTEPRRIAAISTAKFVASSMGVPLGSEVGYQVRFDDFSKTGTKIRFVTDGILLRDFQSDPSLKKYSVVMVDEAHERSENIDFVLGLLKDLLTWRKDLRVVVASATIDEKKFSKYFWDAPVINVSGRVFPVEAVWSDANIEEVMVDAVVERVVEIHKSEPEGDVLVFMAGQDDIHGVIDGLAKRDLQGLAPIPVYASLPPEEQNKIFEGVNGRKVVVATNIAETSITVEGIAYVVDSGLIKQSNFHPEMGIQSLDLVKHSQAGCEQRKGRAGRTRPGLCYRMYTEDDFRARPRFTEPEIKRTSLANVVLSMKDIGIKNIRGFDFIDPPDKEAFKEAYDTLIALGALDKETESLTEIGKSMARLPLEPRVARMVMEAQKHGCVKEVATIAAFLQARNVFFRPKEKEKQWEADYAHRKFKKLESDALTFLRVWEEYETSGFSGQWCFGNFLNAKALAEAANIREQLFKILFSNRVELSEGGGEEAVLKAVSIGLAYNLLEHSSRGSYNGVLRDVVAKVHPGSSVFANYGSRWITATEIVRTNKFWARGCTVVKAEWLPEIVPDLAKFGEEVVAFYTEGYDFAEVRKPIFLRGQEVGTVLSRVSLAEAAKIQDKQIKEAGKNGLIPLAFESQLAPRSLYARGLVASHNGKEYTTHTTSMHEIKEGVTYYCKADPLPYGLYDIHYAVPIFRVFYFPVSLSAVTEAEDKKTGEPLSLANQLAEKWGVKVQ